jgi:hypothetical protein
MADVRSKSRQDRLRAALRENLKRRKQQLKGRAVQGDVPGEPQDAPEDAAGAQDRDRLERD